MSNKIYPIGIQNFEKIRKDGYFYIDKTAWVYQLAKTGSYYFLSRPRRFGKSLLISTLEAYFQGKKDLFKGLAIEKLEKDWTEHPILHLDLNIERYDTPESLGNILEKNLSEWEKLYGADVSERTYSLRFAGIIKRACEQTGQRVVILVDEYDKPVLQAIGNDALQDEYRSTLKSFYSALKSCDRYIQFAFLTGVTKFGKVSVFNFLVPVFGVAKTVADLFRYRRTVSELLALEGLRAIADMPVAGTQREMPGPSVLLHREPFGGKSGLVETRITADAVECQIEARLAHRHPVERDGAVEPQRRALRHRHRHRRTRRAARTPTGCGSRRSCCSRRRCRTPPPISSASPRAGRRSAIWRRSRTLS